MNTNFSVIADCSLCEAHSLHIIGEGHLETQQCINCGYSSAEKLKGFQDDTNEAYKNLTEDMQRWSKYANGRVWIPTVMALPFGMLYPKNINEEMKWCWADMVDIPKGEQKNYPDEQGGFYEKRMAMDDEKVLEHFLEGMVYINEMSKKITEEQQPKPVGLKLPKLKKK